MNHKGQANQRLSPLPLKRGSDPRSVKGPDNSQLSRTGLVQAVMATTPRTNPLAWYSSRKGKRSSALGPLAVAVPPFGERHKD
jgi:hypothetical protein